MDHPENSTTLSVSVVIPAHGVASWVVGAVRSALSQDHVLEVIMIDDASPDDAAAMVREAFGEEPRLKVVDNWRRAGVCGARNAGLELSKAPWIVFLDGDDQLLPGALDALLAGVSPGIAGVFGAFRHVDESGDDVTSSWLADRADAFDRFRQRHLDVALLPRRTFNPPPGGMLLSSDALREVGGWDEGASGVGRSEDFEVVMRVATKGDIALVETEVLRYLQRDGSRSTGSRNNRNRLKTRLTIVRRMPRRQRPAVGWSQGLAYLRLVGPRLRAVGTGGGLRSLSAAVFDLVLMAVFSLWGVACWPLPAWHPRWPPVEPRP